MGMKTEGAIQIGLWAEAKMWGKEKKMSSNNLNLIQVMNKIWYRQIQITMLYRAPTIPKCVLLLSSLKLPLSSFTSFSVTSYLMFWLLSLLLFWDPLTSGLSRTSVEDYLWGWDGGPMKMKKVVKFGNFKRTIRIFKSITWIKVFSGLLRLLEH